MDGDGLPLEAEGKPSDETVVHLAVVRERGAGAVLHTHSVWNTLLSEADGDAGGLAISGYEMLKGLAGVTTHEHAEWVPIVPNTQDYARMTRDVVGRACEAPGTRTACCCAATASTPGAATSARRSATSRSWSSCSR